MAKDRPEELLGQYLATWVDDLREGKGIEISDEDLHELTERQVDELIDMARFTKTVHFPTELWQGQSDDIRARLGSRLFEKRRKQLADSRARVMAADDLGACLYSSRNKLNLSIQDLAVTTGIRKGLLEAVEAGRGSPIRIPAEKMAELLQRLHLAFDETVDLMIDTSERWVVGTFRQDQTQLGRVGRDLDSDERLEAALISGAQDFDSEVRRESIRIKEYADSLRQQIRSVPPKS